jgi:hypothetical protein
VVRQLKPPLLGWKGPSEQPDSIWSLQRQPGHSACTQAPVFSGPGKGGWWGGYSGSEQPAETGDGTLVVFLPGPSLEPILLGCLHHVL